MGFEVFRRSLPENALHLDPRATRECKGNLTENCEVANPLRKFRVDQAASFFEIDQSPPGKTTASARLRAGTRADCNGRTRNSSFH